MIRRSSHQVATLAVLGAAFALAAPASAQIARVRTASADAPKMLVMPFQLDSTPVHGDSALSVQIADGFRDRIKDAYLTRFNPILKDGMNRSLVESGFPTDVPLDHTLVIQLARVLNARLIVEGNVLDKPGDSLLVIARLAEAVGATPQSATASTTLPRARVGHETGADLANRLSDAYRSFGDVQQCRQKTDAHDYAAATRAAHTALERYAGSSGALLCLANIARAQNAPQDTVVSLLRRAASVDSLNTTVRRQLAQIYEQTGDTAALIDQLKHILTVDIRDKDLRIRAARLYVQIGGSKGDTAIARQYADSAVQLIDQGLRQSPADIELLMTKSIALAVARRWADAADQMETVASADTGKVDSLFMVRITNYYAAVPDSTRLLAWLVRAVARFPQQASYAYTLSNLALAKGDTTLSLSAARSYLAAAPNDARGHVLIARVLGAQGQTDSAMVHATAAVAADTNMRRFAAAFYIQAGGKALRDSMWARAAGLLDTARTWSEPRSQIYITASFFEGIAQLQMAVQADQRANATRNDCDDVRIELDLLGRSEQNIAAGAAQNRDQANNLLSNVIPAFRQRANAMSHNYKCDQAAGGGGTPNRP